MKSLEKKHKEFMRDYQADEIRDTNEYLEAKLAMIRVTGEARPKENPHKSTIVKKLEQKKGSITSVQSSARGLSQRSGETRGGTYRDVTHEEYLELMRYLEKYKDFICYESNGVIPKQKTRFAKEKDPIAEEYQLTTE